ncbi:MAG: response regulator [Planctomycetales bacterium]|nr:response regulator [Planctomycetales bacterium]
MSKTILIVDEDRELVQQLSACCKEMGMIVKRAHTAFDAMAIMDERLPDLVCLDVHMPTGADLSICQMMTTDDEAARIPVIVMTERKSRETVELAADMCAYFVRKSPTLAQRLEPLVEELVDLQA